MDFNDLQVIWDSQKSIRIYTIDEESLERNIKLKIRKFNLITLALELGDCFGLLFAGVFFFYLGVFKCPEQYGNEWLDYWYLMLASAGCIIPAGYLLYNRIKAKVREASFEDTIHGHLKWAIGKIDQHIKVYTNVLWLGIILAIGLGATIGATKQIADQSIRFYLWACLLAASVVVYCINRWYVRKMILPKKIGYKRLLAKLLDNGDDSNSLE